MKYTNRVLETDHVRRLLQYIVVGVLSALSEVTPPAFWRVLSLVTVNAVSAAILPYSLNLPYIS